MNNVPKPKSSKFHVLAFSVLALSALVAALNANYVSDQKRQAVADRMYASCKTVIQSCVIAKTQNAKFAQLTQFDYETHRCADGSEASRLVGETVILSTYQLYFTDFSVPIKAAAAERRCTAKLQ